MSGLLVPRIEAWAAADAAKRPAPSKLGAWNIGKCPRALHYMLHPDPAQPPEPLQGRALLTFDLGDRCEDAIFSFLERAGIGFVRTDESRDTVELEVLPGTAIRVRADGFVQDGQDVIPVEVKSMSDFAFERLERGEVDGTYLAQCECYLRAYGANACVLLGYCKSTSHLAETMVERSDERWWALQRAIESAIGEKAPERPYALREACEGCEGSGLTKHAKPRAHEACGGTGKTPGGPFIINFPCGYCADKVRCWGPLEMSITNGGKPKWRLKMAAEEAG